MCFPLNIPARPCIGMCTMYQVTSLIEISCHLAFLVSGPFVHCHHLSASLVFINNLLQKYILCRLLDVYLLKSAHNTVLTNLGREHLRAPSSRDSRGRTGDWNWRWGGAGTTGCREGKHAPSLVGRRRRAGQWWRKSWLEWREGSWPEFGRRKTKGGQWFRISRLKDREGSRQEFGRSRRRGGHEQ